MLNELHIENIAVIERADITFTAGLNVLTGETGAGKSIVIDSIGAVLGERVSRELVRHGAEKGVVTAVFSMDGCEQWLADNEIDADNGRRQNQLPHLRRACDSGSNEGACCAPRRYTRSERRPAAYGRAAAP